MEPLQRAHRDPPPTHAVDHAAAGLLHKRTLVGMLLLLLWLLATGAAALRPVRRAHERLRHRVRGAPLDGRCQLQQ
jgi:hypothetical protein